MFVEKPENRVTEPPEGLTEESHKMTGKDQDDTTKAPKTYLCQTTCPWFGDIRMYTAVFTLLSASSGMYWGYIYAVLGFIERRYQMSSTMSGLMLSSPEFGRLALLLFISHFGNRFNKARVVAVTYTLASIAIFCQTLPHYVIKPDSSTALTLGNETDSPTHILCFPNSSANKGLPAYGDGKTPGITSTTNAAFAIFVTFYVMMGASTSSYSLGLAYIENNSESSQAGKLIGYAFSGWSFGNMLGMLLAAWCANIYVDIEDTSLTPKDPSWIGAWWIGLVIISACRCVVVHFFWCFPRSIPVKSDAKSAMGIELQLSDESTAIKNSATSSSIISPANEEKLLSVPSTKSQESSIGCEKVVTYNFKGLLKALTYLLTNPVYVFLVLGCAALNVYVGGFYAYLPKFTETQFSITAPSAILIIGLINGIGNGVASVFGGQLISCLKLTTRGIFLMVVILSAILIACSVASFFAGCENIAIDGLSDSHRIGSTITPCRSPVCLCDLSVYSPVCDDGLTYFSPCHAGCVSHNITEDGLNNMYLGCMCTGSGTAIQGACNDECKSLIPFIVLTTLGLLSYAAQCVATSLLVIRVVPKYYTSLAIGFSTLANAVIGWLPGAALYGAVIDTTCMVWEETSSGDVGFCWIYDLPAFRYKVIGLNTGCFVVLLVFVWISFMFHRRMLPATDRKIESEVLS